jgi:hypothetical protein
VYEYFSNATNATYLLNTNTTTGTAAEAWCTTQGGHLASYALQEEQVEVEQVGQGRSCDQVMALKCIACPAGSPGCQPLLTSSTNHPVQYFIGAGYLLPTFHKQYYIGLRVTERPWFRWTEPYYELGQESYQHWGAEGSSQEPNNRFPPEDCGAATATQSFGDAWGWSDVNCTRRLIFMCKVLRECHCGWACFHCTQNLVCRAVQLARASPESAPLLLQPSAWCSRPPTRQSTPPTPPLS